MKAKSLNAKSLCLKIIQITSKDSPIAGLYRVELDLSDGQSKVKSWVYTKLVSSRTSAWEYVTRVLF